MSASLSPVAAKRVFLTLSLTRWLPVGFVVGLFTLVARERGLSIQEITLYMTAQGIMVFLLELPTSGFADALGRRPLLIIAGVVNIVAGVSFLVAHSFWQFALSAGLMGIYRALDSGPLEAWYVDTVHEREPGADVHRAMSAQGVLVGVGMGGGALVSGALVAWHPFKDSSALLLPVQIFVALSVVHLLATVVLLREKPRSDSRMRARLAESVRETPAVVRDGVRLVTRNRVLAGLVAVELFWVTGMMAYETLMPLRLSDLLGSEAEAGAWMGPAAAGGWGLFSVGSWLGGRAADRFGLVRAAILGRIVNGLGVVLMGLAFGPVALIVAYLFTYSMHGAASPAYSGLMHREASSRNRATILSLGSLVMQAGGAVVGPLLGLLAARTSIPTAMVVAGVVSTLGFVCFVPAWRHGRTTPVDEAPSDDIGDADDLVETATTHGSLPADDHGRAETPAPHSP
ncbi:Predicted arabinose efflux permease, MFS family [Pedococcus dokdonensis]|uniref:Predicted arabinose efflux permease, MFS family n=1 Tax=Pedococcus dokdonensis TaxID=443156 RepID=A0A1H0KKW3_9MICO|nr:MFS transporter [Pedococcus dokdonensis]SDO56535.1 Predicted arabinose efflux permease, MFS family [Pedococcus dokdonensis]